VDFSDCQVVREYATSKDGTKVPVNIVRRKGIKLDGSNPVLLTGYGGYGINIEPGFSALRRVWIDHGGVFAQANLRGGGEFGEQWHKEGMLTSKQNVFDDFAAAMQYMIGAGYTSPEKLAIIGGSNGGLLMGAMITQHPELCRAVVSSVGIYDMLRVELAPNGEFNIPEFGTVKNPDQFRALYAYSPYHNVRDNTAYPSVLFLTGANDPRVDPMHSRKMTARLQAASSSGRPVLLLTSSKTGHGLATPLSEQIEKSVHYHAFLLNELGL
jgi:prolyl oligopeptidase